MKTDNMPGKTVPVDPVLNYEQSARRIGYIPRAQATRETYTGLGFKCGLEIHQQLLTGGKLFCRCPAGIYQQPDDFDAEVIRHMRPTLSEMGEYDGTALMEKKTRKNITYRIKNRTACTYEIDDTPPFKIDQEALEIAIEAALLLKTNVVGELHITRKQYLDGSIPTGFQRTAIVGIEGTIPLREKNVRIIQISIEEDACREVSDIGHNRIYMTDRLGMPLIETVTYPDMLTPDEAAEAGQYLRFLVRSTGHVRTGIGAARQDVNVSITGGTRVEIKGVSHIKWIPELTHNEAFRQRALLEIAAMLRERGCDPSVWRLQHNVLPIESFGFGNGFWRHPGEAGDRLVAVNLPDFTGLLSFFTQPGHEFADELAGRLKVIACLERPNLIHSEETQPVLDKAQWAEVRRMLGAGSGDAQLLFWGPATDVQTALETIEERCRMAMVGVPNETRKSLPDGTTIFERVLPGPDRMYPDTDSAPLPVREELIERIRKGLPTDVSDRKRQLQEWGVPSDAHQFLLARNLVGLIERIAADFGYGGAMVGALLGHVVKHRIGKAGGKRGPDREAIHQVFGFARQNQYDRDALKALLAEAVAGGGTPEDAARRLGLAPADPNKLPALIPAIRAMFKRYPRSTAPDAAIQWVMGQVRPLALGNIPLGELRALVEKEVSR